MYEGLDGSIEKKCMYGMNTLAMEPQALHTLLLHLLMHAQWDSVINAGETFSTAHMTAQHLVVTN